MWPRDEVCSVLDLGTGSGAIALSLAHERPHWAITGVDNSPAALQVAACNSQNLKLSNVQWRCGSWFDAVPGERFQLIVANPPYIAAADPTFKKLDSETSTHLIAG